MPCHLFNGALNKIKSGYHRNAIVKHGIKCKNWIQTIFLPTFVFPFLSFCFIFYFFSSFPFLRLLLCSYEFTGKSIHHFIETSLYIWWAFWFLFLMVCIRCCGFDSVCGVWTMRKFYHQHADIWFSDIAG